MTIVLEHLAVLMRVHTIPLDALSDIYALRFPGVENDADAELLVNTLPVDDGEQEVIFDSQRVLLKDTVLPGVCGYQVSFSTRTPHGVQENHCFVPRYLRAQRDV
jgi:hypothetical protein